MFNIKIHVFIWSSTGIPGTRQNEKKIELHNSISMEYFCIQPMYLTVNLIIPAMEVADNSVCRVETFYIFQEYIGRASVLCLC